VETLEFIPRVGTGFYVLCVFYDKLFSQKLSDFTDIYMALNNIKGMKITMSVVLIYVCEFQIGHIYFSKNIILMFQKIAYISSFISQNDLTIQYSFLLS
jgi:hypothetical protein